MIFVTVLLIPVNQNIEATLQVILLITLFVQILCNCESLLFNWSKVAVCAIWKFLCRLSYLTDL
jgi:hypothetical protein